MGNEFVATIAIIATIAGASFSVWWNTPDKTPVSYKQLAKALALAAVGAIGLVNLSALPQPTDPAFTWIGLVIMYLFLGAGIGKGANHLQINTPTT